ncbi:hypothetical protein VSR72_41130, partial [Paraburkholderia sp. JHI869]
MASVDARFDPGELALVGHQVFGRRAAMAGVVAGVLALHVALIAVARWEAPASHAIPVRLKIVDAVLIAPTPAVPHKSEVPAREVLPNRPVREVVRIVPTPPTRMRPVARAHAQDITPMTPALTAPRAAPEAAKPTERIA